MTRKLCTNLAKKLFSDSQVRSDHVLRNPLFNFGILLTELVVPFLCGQTKIIDYSFLCSNEGILNNDAKKPLEFRDFDVQLLKIVITDLNQF